jgi:hypothetical protein
LRWISGLPVTPSRPGDLWSRDPVPRLYGYGRCLHTVRAATESEIHLRWLLSERERLPTHDPMLLASFDASDVEGNQRRKLLLRRIRAPILDRLPVNVECTEVLVGEEDLEDLFIIPVSDWYADTGGTFRLLDTVENLQPGRICDVGQGPQPLDHFDKVERMVAYLASDDATRHEEYLVLIATTGEGPFTIIDGTHRATALLRMHRLEPNLPWRAFLMQSPSMSGCRWHIGFDQAADMLAEPRVLADQGKLG